MIVFFLLPVSAFALIFFCFLKKTSLGLRLAFLWASLLWSLAAVAIVEGLSGFHGLTRGLVAGGWELVIVLVLAGFKIFPDSQRKINVLNDKNFSGIELALIGLTAGIIAIVGLTAICAAPNNWDSMTYHLPRVMNWIQNRSVAHYSTHILRQLYQPPGAEFLILHFQILTGGDRFANLIQWFSMAGSVLVLSLVAAELGAGRTGQVLTGLLAAAIPMGILQGSSTQNDYVAGFWLAGAVYFFLRLINPSTWVDYAHHKPLRAGWFDRLGAGLSLGLAILTKGTVYVFAVPFAIWFLINAFLKKRKDFWRDLAVIALICLTVNAGHYSRNIKLFGTPLSSGSESYVSEGGILGAGVSNVIRNLALHLGTPSPRINTFLKEGINQIHSVLVRGNPEQTTWGDFDIPAPSTNEDIAGNPLHLLLILGIFAMFFFTLRNRASRKSAEPVWAYTLTVTAAFLLFCGYFKWQLFHSRLHLPLFLLSMPVAGLMIAKARQKAWVLVLVLILTLAAYPPLFFNERRPLLAKKNIFNTSRLEQYFFYRKFMLLPYAVTAQYVSARGWKDVGLLLAGDDWEYPLWVFLQFKQPGIHLRHVNVKNVSGSLASDAGKNPPAVISEIEGQPDFLVVGNTPYLKRQRFTFMSLYENIRP